MFFAFCCIISVVLLVVAIYIAFFKDEDYSLNELKSFIKINGVYLKEIDNE